MSIIDPHTQHCCSVHGCRFNNNDHCSVFKGTAIQLNECGQSSICPEYGIHEGAISEGSNSDN